MSIFKQHCDELQSCGLQLTQVRLQTLQTQQLVKLQIHPDHLPNQASCAIDGDNKIPHIANLLLKHGVSIKFYHELAAFFKPQLPRSYKVTINLYIDTCAFK